MSSRLAFLALAVLMVPACSGDESDTKPGPSQGEGGGGPAAGSEGGPCYGNGTCDDGLVCADGVCKAPAAGSEGGPCYGNGTCDDGLVCVEGVCQAPAEGSDGGPCRGDGSCDDGLVCSDGVCGPPAEGAEGGPCYGNGTCDDGLVCSDGVCVQDPGEDETRWAPCDPTQPDRDVCGPGYVCIGLADAGGFDRAGTCLRSCGPIDVGTCEVDQVCQEGELCVRSGTPSVDAINVCVPTCDPGTWEDGGECYPGTFACAASLVVSGETLFDCRDDHGGSEFVCLP